MGQANQRRGIDFEHGAQSRPSANGDRSTMSGERRRSFRVNVPGRVSVWLKGELRGRYDLMDVSIGGCSLSGGPPRKVGEELDVMLHLPHKTTLALHATVRRADSGLVGLRFEKAPPRAEDCLQDVVVEAFAREHQGNGHVALVIEPRHAIRQAMVRTLRELGQPAIGVATALDAVQLLVEEGERIDTAFIEAETTSLPSFELVEFLAHNHPRVRRVLMGDSTHIEASWLAEATGEVHALLETPCNRDVLHRLLARIGNVPQSTTLS
jgi:hypothetical protein